MKKTLLCALASMALSTIARAADITVYDSIVTLATNGTKYYQFKDQSSGQSVTMTVTMTPHSSDAAAVFSSLDGDTRVGVGNPGIPGDGNLIVQGEGANFSASVATTSSGVTAGSVQFRITSIGLRPPDGASAFSWNSSAGSKSISISNSVESIQSLDTSLYSLSNGAYSGQLVVTDSGDAQLTDVPGPGQSIAFNVTFAATGAIDPRTNSWITAYAGQYARIFTTDANKASGASVTTWSNGTENQTAPAYCGIQEVYSSSNWVYIRSSGLASHIMGPWMNGNFPNLPVNTKTLYRIPRMPTTNATHKLTGLGAIGYFVDGVAMFDSRDGFVWTGTTESGNGTGYWNREAYTNEGVSFDPGFAHQEQTGTHHYHANPIALRYQLGDHVDYIAASKTYAEATNAVTKHSPILGWVRDGNPIYGPYAYSNALDPDSPIIRMRTGFQLRNGQRGTQNLSVVGRTNIPPWAVRLYGVSANQTCTNVNGTYVLGRYMEDYDFLGDLVNTNTGSNYTQGVNFDLDVYNGRWCVTPEFPTGIYAYFVSIESNGIPKFPNNIGRAFYGSPTGSTVTAISEVVTTNFLGSTNLVEKINSLTANNGTVTLTWSALEGGSYRVDSTTNFTGWTTAASNLSPTQTIGSYTSNSALDHNFYRVARTGLATYDPPGTTVFGASGFGILSISPTNAARGATFTLTINLDSTVNPPPQNAPINSVALGSITGMNNVHVSASQLTSVISIPAGFAAGPQTVTVVFPGPPGQATNVVTYTFENGFTVN